MSFSGNPNSQKANQKIESCSVKAMRNTRLAMFLAFDYLYLGGICAMKSQGSLAARVCNWWTADSTITTITSDT